MVRQFSHALVQLVRDERGVAAIEYGLIVALTSLLVVAAMTRVGTEIRHTYEVLDQTFTAALSN